MRIEDELRNLSVESSARHKEVLRARLLAHMETIPMKKHRSYKWLVAVATPLAALVVIVGANVWQPGPNEAPNIVQKATEPLTAKQVFAAARAAAETNAQHDGEAVYYQKLNIRDHTGNCEPYQEYYESYTDKNGVLRKSARYNSQGKLIESASFDSTGKLIGEVYFDHSASWPEIPRDTDESYPSTYVDRCAQLNLEIASDSEQRAFIEHMERVATAFGYQGTEHKPLFNGGHMYLVDLRSGDAKKQAAVFQKLEDLNEWTVKQNVQAPDIAPGELIELHYSSGPRIFEKLYFSQDQKAFVGASMLDPLSIGLPYTFVVVEQGLRPISSVETN